MKKIIKIVLLFFGIIAYGQNQKIDSLVNFYFKALEISITKKTDVRENSIYLFNEFKSKYSMSIFKMGLRNFQNFIINNKGKM